MAGEVIGTELIGGMQTVLYQVVNPDGHHIPVRLYVSRVTVEFADFGSQGKHVTGLLEGHIATIYLLVSQRILAQVVSGEGLGPTAALAIVEDRGHHGLLQVGIVAENQRSLRISKVNGVHTTVGVILLGEP